jgi:hypothetical protein
MIKFGGAYMLAALAWVSTFALIWLFIFAIVPLTIGSGAALLFFFLVAVIATAVASPAKGERDGYR